MINTKNNINLEFKKIPNHVIIVLNYESTQKSTGAIEAHNSGVLNLLDVMESCVEFKIKILTINLFPESKEVDPVVTQKASAEFIKYLLEYGSNRISKSGVKIQVLGNSKVLNNESISALGGLIKSTENNTQLTVNILINYSGRAELIQAIQEMIQDKVDPKKLDETEFRRRLYLSELIDPDLVIQLDNDFCISDTLLWQSTYAEIYVTHINWIDFDKNEFIQAVHYYNHRDRRFGVLPILEANNK